MVILTRSAYKKACSSSDTSNDSQISKVASIPPWCSGKVCERKKPRKATWEIRSSYPLRENIWEYLHEDKNFFSKKYNRRISCKQTVKNKRRKSTIVVVFALFVLLTLLLWMTTSIPDTSLVTKVISRTSFVSLLNLEFTTSVDEECCYRMKHLAAALMRAEEALRSALRLRKSMMLTAQSAKFGPHLIEKESYIQDAIVTKGSGTKQWGGRVALWGVVPLWRAAPPPDTVLASRKPTPSDCWPFSGSYGELNFDFSKERNIHSISIEHVRPDTAESAPKHFILYELLSSSLEPGFVPLMAIGSLANTLRLKHNCPNVCVLLDTSAYQFGDKDVMLCNMNSYDCDRHPVFLVGILENDTWITTVDSEYRQNGPAKQYYRLIYRHTPLRRLVFRVLTNQGNTKYTCIYRVYLYENLN